MQRFITLFLASLNNYGHLQVGYILHPCECVREGHCHGLVVLTLKLLKEAY